MRARIRPVSLPGVVFVLIVLEAFLAFHCHCQQFVGPVFIPPGEFVVVDKSSDTFCGQARIVVPCFERTGLGARGQQAQHGYRC